MRTERAQYFPLCLVILSLFSAPTAALAQFRTSYGTPAVRRSAPAQRSNQPAQLKAGVYPEFRTQYGVIRWLNEQMPLKVYIADGTSLDSIIDEQLGASAMNVDNRDHWPDVVAQVIGQPERLQSLPQAIGFTPDLKQAAITGINSWKPFEKEGIFSFVLTNDPGDADIYVFWTNHFVNKLGMGLFAKDIRGYTAKRSFPLAAIRANQPIQFRPVVTILRTVDGQGNPMPPDKMRASAAHEFGHALGIEGHSSNPNDLMSVFYGHGAISASDAATIRQLYHMTPDLVP
ncbi:MAG: matrixin family metalloprotease [Candidatus Obscuribacterales bacterium]|nr:matrixin family metalloprotease [Candidatus Obscuribacterales bacterium]